MLPLKKLTKTQIRNRMMLVDALHSGKYKQGKNRLVRIHKTVPSSYCCLGVACTIAGVSDEDLDGGTDLDDVDVDRFTRPSQSIQSMYGFTYDGIALFDDPIGVDTVSLIQLNDNLGFSFDEIADVIHLDTLMRS